MAALEHAARLETGAAALLFALVFLLGHRVHPFRAWGMDRRGIISFSAGMSAAYVFVHLMPELHGVREALTNAVSAELPFEGASVYYVAMIGFLAFYGLDHLRSRIDGDAGDHGFTVHIGGFAAYVWLVAYLLVHSLEETSRGTALYAVALAVHFLTVDHSLDHEHGAAYRARGRFVLAAMSIAGWLAGLAFALPPAVITVLVAFVSGAVIMNSAIMELPAERDGRFFPFVAGGLLYGAVLLPL